MVQAIALLAAFVLTVTFQHSALARSYPCWMVRMYVSSHSAAEVDAMSLAYDVTKEEKAAARACFPKKKRRR